MFSPRNLIIAGVALIAISLGPSGHGLWWLFGFLWLVPHAGRRGHACRGASRSRPERVTTSQPDPTKDRHQAFPAH